jgi:hypothetical protein
MYRCRASELYLTVDDPLAAFFFDKAVGTFGSLVEQAMHQAGEGKSGKKAELAVHMALETWLGPQRGKPAFRDPAQMARERRR